jgi:hypothetical protein
LYLRLGTVKVRELLLTLMQTFRTLTSRFLLGLCLAGMAALPSFATEKMGMPDIGQEEQTCLPTSTANLIVWFGTHGYPKLIVPGDSADDNYTHTVHALMTDTHATYQLGTRTEAITYGIGKYIRDAGYSCDVEYRGLDWSQAKYPDIVKDPDEDLYKPYEKTPSPFTQDWLQENDDPNKGFILLLAYVAFNQSTNTFTDAINAGHAVTLVNAEPDMILIHDPAHYEDEPGRKILTPQPLTGGTFQLPGYNAPLGGLMLLSGTLMDTPPDAGILLTGAVCVTMHPTSEGTKIIGGSVGAPNGTIGGGGNVANNAAPSSTPSTPSKPVSSPSSSWTMWLFDLLFKK